MGEVIKDLADHVWTLFEFEAHKFCNENDEFVVYKDAKEIFAKSLEYYYFFIMKNFMNNDVESLDRHKVAAIIVCALLESDPVGISVKAKRNFFYLVNETVALSVALSFMQQQLKDEFDYEMDKKIDISKKEIPYEKLFDGFYSMPESFSCDRDFGEILARDLYYAKKHFQLNPMSLSIIMFLIELHSFDAAGIKRIYSKVEEKNKQN